MNRQVSLKLTLVCLSLIAVLAISCARKPSATPTPSNLGESRQKAVPIGTALEMYAYPGAQELTVLEAGVYQGSTDNGQMLRVKVRIRAIQATEYSAYQFKVVGAEDTPQYEMPYWHREMAAGAISVEEFLFDIRGEDSSQLFLRWNPAAGDPRYFALQ